MLLGLNPIDKLYQIIEVAKDVFKYVFEVICARYYLFLLVFYCIYYDITDSKYNYSVIGQIMLDNRDEFDYYLLVWAFKHY